MHHDRLNASSLGITVGDHVISTADRYRQCAQTAHILQAKTAYQSLSRSQVRFEGKGWPLIALFTLIILILIILMTTRTLMALMNGPNGPNGPNARNVPNDRKNVMTI